MKNQGFTLIELSIVVVIIGLIVAGVTGGQKLVEQAKLRNVVSDIKSLEVSINAFILQYGERPGDLSNAHDYWGSSCHSSASTCNGNGDGKIYANNGESYMLWRHMKLAEVIKGEYSGLANGSAPLRTGDNAFLITNNAVLEPDNNSTYGGNYLEAQIETASSNWDAAFSGKGMRWIDVKMDDGVRDSGVVRGTSGNSVTCINSDGAVGKYVMTDDIVCRGAFILGAY
jgi:prepilin-type N-terminal cleavage/methylation domain-containing protein